MTKKIKVSVSILCADFLKLGEEIRKCEDAGVDEIHVDIMDGHFVPVVSIGPMIIDAVRQKTSLKINAHLMVEHPFMHIDQCLDAGADSLSIHAECYGKLRPQSDGLGKFPKEIDSIDANALLNDVQKIRTLGKEAFVVLNPGTPMCLAPVLDKIDGILIMSVNPGFAKQKFMPEVLAKVRELRTFFQGPIAIDGGLNQETAPLAVEAGVNIIATASYFFGSENALEVVRYLKSLEMRG